MGSSTKTGTSATKSRGKFEHWKDLPRDSKGRWVKRTPSQKSKPKTPRTAPISAKEATTHLDKIKEEFDEICPRCSGDMKFHRIRCGPEKTVKVKKCMVCNFWLPLSEAVS